MSILPSKDLPDIYIKSNRSLRFFKIELKLSDTSNESILCGKLLKSQFDSYEQDEIYIESNDYTFLINHSSKSEEESVIEICEYINNILYNNSILNNNIINFKIQRH